MTLLVCVREPGCLTLLADTRISGQIGTVTDSGPKVLSIPVVVAHGRDDPLPSVTGTYGFAFAGSTLVAMSTLALASTCLQSLVTPEAPRLPSVASVADLIRRLGERFMREVGSPFDCFIVGPDPDGGEPFGFSNRAFLTNGRLEIATRELERDRKGLWALGSGAQSYMDFAHEHRPWPTIMASVEAFIQSNVEQTVGGFLQAGRCGSKGFSPYIVLGSPSELGVATASFLGISEQEIGLIDGLDIGADAIGPRSAFHAGAFSSLDVPGNEGLYRGYWYSDELPE